MSGGFADLRAATSRDPDACRTRASTSCSSSRRRSPVRRRSRRRRTSATSRSGRRSATTSPTRSRSSTRTRRTTTTVPTACHRVHRLRRRPRPTAIEIAVAGGAEEFPQDSDGYGFTGVTCLQTPVAGAGDRRSRRHDRPGVGDRRAEQAGPGADDLRTRGHAERRQARRRERRCSSSRYSAATRAIRSGRRPQTARGRGLAAAKSDPWPTSATRDPEPDDAAALAAAVLEAEIRRTEAAVVPEVVLADAELPGVGEDAMSLREALRIGGVPHRSRSSGCSVRSR